MNQWKLATNTRSWSEERENAHERVTISSTPDMMTKWHEFFQPITRRINTNANKSTITSIWRENTLACTLSISRSKQFSVSVARENLRALKNRQCSRKHIHAYFRAKWRPSNILRNTRSFENCGLSLEYSPVSAGKFSHVMRLDKSSASEYIWWIIAAFDTQQPFLTGIHQKSCTQQDWHRVL